ncbi:MAG: SDR family NAD(P)-dependent oxidoreductase [Lachnospiraceae bacterium]|nr:SDR family NAD(P)-dependent oxidoreductase [Lachnospiraceae bacterium]
MRKNIIIITGASSGIGQEFALQIDTAFSNIDEIWLIARREERLTEVAKVMEHTTKLICMDVTDEYAMDDFERLLEESNVTVRMLINAAGMGLMGSFEDIPLEEQLEMLTVNCEALTKMTYITLPYMAGGSRIIQLASSAAFLPQPDFAVYAATKSYVLSLSRALNRELAYRGIYVTAVCPGPVNTEFFSIAEQYGSTLAVKKLTMITSEKCVADALRASYNKQSMAVPGIPMKAFLLAAKFLPHEVLLRLSQLLGGCEE